MEKDARVTRQELLTLFRLANGLRLLAQQLLVRVDLTSETEKCKEPKQT